MIVFVWPFVFFNYVRISHIGSFDWFMKLYSLLRFSIISGQFVCSISLAIKKPSNLYFLLRYLYVYDIQSNFQSVFNRCMWMVVFIRLFKSLRFLCMILRPKIGLRYWKRMILQKWQHKNLILKISAKNVLQYIHIVKVMLSL